MNFEENQSNCENKPFKFIKLNSKYKKIYENKQNLNRNNFVI